MFGLKSAEQKQESNHEATFSTRAGQDHKEKTGQDCKTNVIGSTLLSNQV